LNHAQATAAVSKGVGRAACDDAGGRGRGRGICAVGLGASASRWTRRIPMDHSCRSPTRRRYASGNEGRRRRRWCAPARTSGMLPRPLPNAPTSFLMP